MTIARATAKGNVAATVREVSAGLKLTALAAGFVMASLDITVINVAGATIQERLHTTLTQLTWIVDGYVLAFASLLLLGGGLANRMGAKVVYMWGMAIFVAASLACSVSPNGAMLIAARCGQGAGAALFMPSSLSLLVFAFPGRRERTRMLGLWSAIVAVSAGVGPTLGGLTVSTMGWRAIFLLNLPVGIIGMALTARYISGAAKGRTTRLAVPGHVIWIAALAALSFALIEGSQMGWSAGPVLAAYVAVAVAALLLVSRERHTANPIMPWTLFRDRGFAGANAVGFLFNFAIFGCLFMLGLYLQNARGASPTQAGLELLSVTGFFPVVNVVYSRISGRFANGPLLTFFLLVAAVASFTMVTVSASTPYWVLAFAVGIANLGAGIIAPGMTAALVDAAGPENASIAGSVLNTNRQIGALVGIAAIGAVLYPAHDWNEGAAHGFGLIGMAYLGAALCAWRFIVRSERSGADRPSGRSDHREPRTEHRPQVGAFREPPSQVLEQQGAGGGMGDLDADHRRVSYLVLRPPFRRLRARPPDHPPVITPPPRQLGPSEAKRSPTRVRGNDGAAGGRGRPRGSTARRPGNRGRQTPTREGEGSAGSD